MNFDTEEIFEEENEPEEDYQSPSKRKEMEEEYIKTLELLKYI